MTVTNINASVIRTLKRTLGDLEAEIYKLTVEEEVIRQKKAKLQGKRVVAIVMIREYEVGKDPFKDCVE